jgi:hypothetical protein
MWTRLIGRLLALFGLYALVLAAIGRGFDSKKTAGFTNGMMELVGVTLIFIAACAFVFIHRPKAPLD